MGLLVEAVKDEKLLQKAIDGAFRGLPSVKTRKLFPKAGVVQKAVAIARTGWIIKPPQPKESDMPLRAAKFVARVISEHSDLSAEALFRISNKPEKPEYTERVANALGSLGINGWSVDIAASLEASLIPNPNGYGNQRTKVRGPAQLIMRRVAEPQTPELTIVPDESLAVIPKPIQIEVLQDAA